MKRKMLSLTCASLILSNMYAQDILEEVLITAKVKSEVIDTAGSFSILDQEDLKTLNANSVQDVLENTVGINVSANNQSINGRKNITFRGMNPEHTAILINGKRISNSDAQIGHSDFQYNWIPLSAISKMEIIRGPMSSLYGSKALGGVVNIITKKPEEGFGGMFDTKISSTQGNNLSKTVSLNLSGDINEKLAVSIFAEKSKYDVIENKKGKNKPSSFEGKNISNIMLDAWYSVDDTQEITASIRKGKEIRNALSFDLFKTIQRNGIESYSDFDKLYKIDKEHYSLSYNKFFDFGTLDLKTYSTSSDVHNDSFKYTHKLKDEVLNGEIIYENLNNHYIVFGADFRKEIYEKEKDSTNNITKDFKSDILYKSFYIQDEIEINENLLLTLGSRIDKHEMFNAQFSPKFYGVYKMGNNQRLKFGYGRGFNAPTLTQLSDEYRFINQNAGHAFIGNSNLKPEISDTYELGYEYNEKESLMKATFFFTKLKNLISAKKTNVVAGANSVGDVFYYDKYSNVSSSNMYGLELEYEKNNILRNLDLNFAYTYLKTKDKDKNRELNFRPRNKINTSLKYNFDSTMFIILSAAYTGKQKNYDDNQKILTIMDGYITSSIQLSKNITKELNIRIGIDNFSNEKLADEFNFSLRPRTYYANLSYKF